MMADRHVPEERWRVVTELKSDPELTQLDELVNRAVPKKALSMRTNKLLFNHVLLVSERDAWRRRIDHLHTMSTAPLERGFLEIFRRAAVERVLLALRKGGVDKLEHIDTNGKEAQRRAMKERRRVLGRFATSAQRRAESVRAWLSARGVAASRLSAIGAGESRLVRAGDSEADHQANRRVEIRIRG